MKKKNLNSLNSMTTKLKALGTLGALAALPAFAWSIPSQAEPPTGHFNGTIVYDGKLAEMDLFIRRVGGQYFAAQFRHLDPKKTKDGTSSSKPVQLDGENDTPATFEGGIYAIEETQSGLLAFKPVRLGTGNATITISNEVAMTAESLVRKIRGGRIIGELRITVKNVPGIPNYYARPAYNPENWVDLDPTQPFFGRAQDGAKGELTLAPGSKAIRIDSSLSESIGGPHILVGDFGQILATRKLTVDLHQVSGDAVDRQLDAFIIPMEGNGFGGHYHEIRVLTREGQVLRFRD